MAPGIIASVLAEGVEGVIAPSKKAGAPIAAQALMEEVGAVVVLLKGRLVLCRLLIKPLYVLISFTSIAPHPGLQYKDRLYTTMKKTIISYIYVQSAARVHEKQKKLYHSPKKVRAKNETSGYLL